MIETLTTHGPRVALSLALGVATWSLAEYLMHRFMGHRWRKNFFGVEHTRHHAEGNYFAATWKKLIFAGVMLAVMLVGVGLWLGWPIGAGYSLGFTGFYLTYELLHRRAHTHPPTGWYSRWLRRHHFWHHFGDPRSNHGVTSPIWDVVFGTRRAPKRIRVPPKLAMPWLFDPADGDVWPAFRADYSMRGRPSDRA